MDYVALAPDAAARRGLYSHSPPLPELVTQGDTVAETLANAEDAFAAIVELYEDFRRTLPQSPRLPAGEPFGVEVVITASAS